MPSLTTREGGRGGGGGYKIEVYWDPFCGVLMENCLVVGDWDVLPGLKLQ